MGLARVRARVWAAGISECGWYLACKAVARAPRNARGPRLRRCAWSIVPYIWGRFFVPAGNASLRTRQLVAAPAPPPPPPPTAPLLATLLLSLRGARRGNATPARFAPTPTRSCSLEGLRVETPRSRRDPSLTPEASLRPAQERAAMRSPALVLLVIAMCAGSGEWNQPNKYEQTRAAATRRARAR
jgi:hypothetical protein